MNGLRRHATKLLLLAVILVLVGASAAWRYRTSRPEYLLRQGQDALLLGDWDKTDRMAARLEAAGHADRAHYLRGYLYLRQGRLNHAILQYNQISHDRPEVLVEASVVFGVGFLLQNRPVEAEPFLLYALEQRPDDIQARRGLAVLYYDRGAMNLALKHLRRWSELDPEDGQSHRFIGLIYEALGADGPAAEAYRASLARRLPPAARREALLEFAELLVKRTENAEALACLDLYEAENSETPPTLPELRAACLYGLGRTAEALHVLQPVLAASTASPRALRVRAQIHANANETAAAVELLETALRMDRHDTACRYQLAAAYELLGRRTEAAEQRRFLDQSQKLFKELSDLNRVAMDKPRDAKVRRRLADVCDQLNKPHLAQMWLRAAARCPTAEAMR
jgi:tetratricopeptide (TPR) repeat protein